MSPRDKDITEKWIFLIIAFILLAALFQGCSSVNYSHMHDTFKYSCERNGGRYFQTAYLDQTCVYNY